MVAAVRIWAGISYGQQTQLHFTDGNLNAQIYLDEIQRPVVVPFIRHHHLMFQHDNAWPMSQGSVHNSKKLKMSQFSHGLNTHVWWHGWHVWDALDWRVRQPVPISANIQQLQTAIEEEWDNVPQAIINSRINSMRIRGVALHEGNGGHTRYWLVLWSRPLPFSRCLWSTDAYLYSQSCEIHILGPN